MIPLKSFVFKWRAYLQAAATLISNPHLANFFRGKLYTGSLKKVCVPGLNCYSCPAATGACPIGAFQSVVGSPSFKFSYYIMGSLFLIGVAFGRAVCGFFCPFGWFQDLLHRLPFPKRSTERYKYLTYLKYIVSIFVVWLLGVLITDETGLSLPYFCKYICPQGILEGAIPLSLTQPSLRGALGSLFALKAGILAVVVIASAVYYRPFCKWICPLGAVYALFNKISFVQFTVDDRCIDCGKCASVCKMDVDITEDANAEECIRCGDCLKSCPTGAIRAQIGHRRDNEDKKQAI